MKNNTNKIKTHYQLQSEITLDGDRFFRPGEKYSFRLKIEHLESVLYIRRLCLLLGENCWSWEINTNFPYYVPLQVDLPRIIDSWYPHFIIEGIDNQGLLQEIDLYFNRPIISTTSHPIYDARLARSNWNIDEWKIEPIKILLNKFGLDSSTLGIEVQIPFSKGRSLLDVEKEWAVNGDCFISILTERDRSFVDGHGLPPAWTHTESGLSFISQKPILSFVEKGVRIDALYKYLDSEHIIYFKNGICEDYERKLLNFRIECEKFRSNKNIHTLGNITLVGLAFLGGLTLVDYFFGK